MEKSRHMSGENKAETRYFIEEIFDQGNLDMVDELVPPEWVHHDLAYPEVALRQWREISEPLKGSAKTPRVTLGPVGERVRRLAKFELGLSAVGLNPSGAWNLDLKQRTERSNEKVGG
jgi:hypothetical protein